VNLNDGVKFCNYTYWSTNDTPSHRFVCWVSNLHISNKDLILINHVKISLWWNSWRQGVPSLSPYIMPILSNKNIHDVSNDVMTSLMGLQWMVNMGLYEKSINQCSGVLLRRQPQCGKRWILPWIRMPQSEGSWQLPSPDCIRIVQKIFVISKFSYLLCSCNPTPRTETGTAKRSEVVKANHLNYNHYDWPIKNNRERAAIRSDHIYYMLLFSRRCTTVLRFVPASPTDQIYAGEQPFS
jgi:hypothetical protein